MEVLEGGSVSYERGKPWVSMTTAILTQVSISHKTFFKSFGKIQFPQKSVNSFFIFVIVNDTLTDLWGS